MLSHIPNRPGEITLREMILAVKAISVLSWFGLNYLHYQGKTWNHFVLLKVNVYKTTNDKIIWNSFLNKGGLWGNPQVTREVRLLPHEKSQVYKFSSWKNNHLRSRSTGSDWTQKHNAPRSTHGTKIAPFWLATACSRSLSFLFS